VKRLFMKNLRLMFITLTLMACVGCGKDSGCLVILTTDTSTSTETDLAQRLALIEMLFDATDGFSGINKEQPQAEGFNADDYDGDGEIELLLTMNVAGRRTLPIVRLDPGQNSNKEISIRVRGLDAENNVVAFGGISPQTLFVDNELHVVTVPIHLSRAQQVPRIVALSPNALPYGSELGAIAFYSSKLLKPDTLAGNVSVKLTRSGPGADLTVEGTVGNPRSCPFQTQMWTFVPSQCYEESGGHRFTSIQLTIGPQVTDLEDNPLQDADGNPGVTTTIETSQLRYFGPCASRDACDVAGFDSSSQIDIACNTQTGYFEPAACTLVPSACRDKKDAFDWLQAADDAGCLAYRENTFNYIGGCIVSDPWPCTQQSACFSIGDGNCTAGQCTPTTCTGPCTDQNLTCVLNQGCLPGLGGCAENCLLSGGCPELNQECVQAANDVGVCH
jgi:hypothetical protein